ncbi:hypothetical protein WSS15_30940 [Acetobacter pasteurianus]|uniref:hypothetical protein n=1 Tax=Acetobacter pasteurianus TaxID=438 RepID=UPI0022C0EF14|nr:hypothetical protein [Acetobacter pasteurianus]GLH30444.1 hypothetical protein WSS15_30940 [Acetobacter pasteurianus]
MSNKSKRFPPEFRERAAGMVLEEENRELRQANEILRKASAYFAQAELDRLCGRPFKGNASHCLSHAISKTYYSTGG